MKRNILAICGWIFGTVGGTLVFLFITSTDFDSENFSRGLPMLIVGGILLILYALGRFIYNRLPEPRRLGKDIDWEEKRQKREKKRRKHLGLLI